ncbi:hypothetical protein [Nonomuraea sp. NPDC050310]|uniref:hypothetical protein n=1 Tax=Nonomuraea sp. NPDC050310 TaxID=3154935 RepID=UPI0033DE40A5
MILFAVASLHHPRCRASEWREQGHHAISGDFVSWRARAMIVPLMHGDEPAPRPMLLVNPGLESIFLRPDEQGGWQVTVGDVFHAAGLRPPGSADQHRLPIGVA